MHVIIASSSVSHEIQNLFSTIGVVRKKFVINNPGTKFLSICYSTSGFLLIMLLSVIVKGRRPDA